MNGTDIDNTFTEFQTKQSATEIDKIVCEKCLVHKIIQFAIMMSFFINKHIFCHLKLQGLLAIPVSNK